MTVTKFYTTSITNSATNEFTISWESVVSSTYRIEQSTDIENEESWTDITEDIVAAEEATSHQIMIDLSTVEKAFWRVRLVD